MIVKRTDDIINEIYKCLPLDIKLVKCNNINKDSPPYFYIINSYMIINKRKYFTSFFQGENYEIKYCIPLYIEICSFSDINNIHFNNCNYTIFLISLYENKLITSLLNKNNFFIL